MTKVARRGMKKKKISEMTAIGGRGWSLLSLLVMEGEDKPESKGVKMMMDGKSLGTADVGQTKVWPPSVT